MDKTSPQNDFSFKILEEKVATKDCFEDKAHEKVANTLTTLINRQMKAFTSTPCYSTKYP